ncbi:MAG: Uncharacterised protein [Flavobacteriaceae bacterium]|nr:MAG: Uncharacterised protein [Flavobacteriaceae bacterium]
MSKAIGVYSREYPEKLLKKISKVKYFNDKQKKFEEILMLFCEELDVDPSFLKKIIVETTYIPDTSFLPFRSDPSFPFFGTNKEKILWDFNNFLILIIKEEETFHTGLWEIYKEEEDKKERKEKIIKWSVIVGIIIIIYRILIFQEVLSF